MNAATFQCRGRRPFVAVKAEDYFRAVVNDYFEVHCSEERLDERAAAQVAKAMAEGHPDRTTELRAVLEDHKRLFEWMRTKFFFTDICPENRGRFPVAFEECFPKQG